MKISGITFKECEDAVVSIAYIGPDEAAVIIANMVENQRTLSAGKVREYAKEMTDGKWRLSNDACVVCGGKWLNSQHRMHAVVQSKTVQPFLILETDDAAIIRVLDGGKVRRVADVLKMETGTSWEKDIASTACLVLAYKQVLLSSSGWNGGKSGSLSMELKKIVTRQDRIAFTIKHHKEVRELITHCNTLYTRYGPTVSRSMGASVMMVIKERDGIEAATKFIDGVYTGENISDAQRAVRLVLLRDDKQRFGMSTVVRFGTILKAYVFHRDNKPVKLLVLKSTEPFPKV